MMPWDMVSGIIPTMSCIYCLLCYPGVMKDDPTTPASPLEVLRARHVALRLEAIARGRSAKYALTVTERRIARSLAILSQSYEAMAKSAHLLGTGAHHVHGP
jgi:hypothetical protein